MKIGYVFLIAATLIFLASGFIYGWEDIMPFGYILAGIGIIVLSDYLYNRNK